MKKGIQEVLSRSVMCLYEHVETKVRVILRGEERFMLKWGCTKDLHCRFFFHGFGARHH